MIGIVMIGTVATVGVVTEIVVVVIVSVTTADLVMKRRGDERQEDLGHVGARSEKGKSSNAAQYRRCCVYVMASGLWSRWLFVLSLRVFCVLSCIMLLSGQKKDVKKAEKGEKRAGESHY
jgi:mannitol-specific phosphotransferase system IIBC component